MKEKTKKFWMTLLLFTLIQYVPAVAIMIGPYLERGALLNALQSGLLSIVTGVVYILLMKIEKLKNMVLPKVIKFLIIWNIAGGLLFVILGITVFR